MNQEQHWIEAARGGDREAFGRLVQAYQRPVYNLTYRMLGNAEEAEDAAQEVFIRVYRKLDTFDPQRKFSTWILSIASHYCIDRLRRRRLKWLSLEDERLPPSVLISHQDGPERNVMQNEQRIDPNSMQHCRPAPGGSGSETVILASPWRISSFLSGPCTESRVRLALHTLGCKANQYDTQCMRESLSAAGYTMVEWGGVADVYVVNTCTVTSRSDRKSRKAVMEAHRLNGNASIYVTGCYATREKDLLESLPGVRAAGGREDHSSAGFSSSSSSLSEATSL